MISHELVAFNQTFYIRQRGSYAIVSRNRFGSVENDTLFILPLGELRGFHEILTQFIEEVEAKNKSASAQDNSSTDNQEQQ